MSHHDDKLNRREFLAATGTLGAGALLAGALEDEAEAALGSIPLVPIGGSGAKVSQLIFGTSVTLSLPLLKAYTDLGGRAFDTARDYKNERPLAGFLRQLRIPRNELFIATKLPERLQGQAATMLAGELQKSLDELQMTFVNALFLHNLTDPNVLKNTQVRRAFDNLRGAGKIRFAGISTHHRQAVACLSEAARQKWPPLLMVKYNFREYGNQALQDALKRCKDAGLFVIAMKVQGGHLGAAKIDPLKAKGYTVYQAALRATLNDSNVQAVVSAMKTLAHVRENCRAALQKPGLAQAEWDALREYAQETDHLYCRGCDHLCGGACDRPLAIADILRYKMYHDFYEEPEKARHLYARLPAEAKDLSGVDFAACEAACPYRVPIGDLLREATEKLA
jgi:predicted aldo/keto reductase-like oxidoreductase